MAIAVSPDYDDDDVVVVVTEASFYISQDRGDAFALLEPTAGWSTPTSIDLALDADGNLGAWLVGDSIDVYLHPELIGSWTPQGVGDSVLAVAFSPNYDDDELIVAVVSGGGDTRVRVKSGNSTWNTTIPDAILYDTTGIEPETFNSERACIGIPDDFSATNPTLFVGVSADGVGDIYKIAKDGGDWVATDLNVRDSGIYEKTQTDIWSISVNGNAADAVILVGTVTLDVDVTPRQYLTYVSDDGGLTWQACDKQPTGEEIASVVLGSAYVGTRGAGSALSAADPSMMSWNQIGLIDVVIDEISDVAPSPTYAADGVLYMVTYNEVMEESSLWETSDGGSTWERIYSSKLTDIAGEPDTCYFDVVRSAGASGIFVAEKGTTEMRLSNDAGVTFSTRVVAKEAITTLTVVDTNLLYTGDANGNVWETNNGGITWGKPTASEIAGMVIQIEIGTDGAILVGNDAGTVYICYDRAVAFEFERVGPGAAGTGITVVAFDTDYLANDIVYAACTGTGAVYRFVMDESTTWTKLEEGIVVSELAAANDGTLYISDADPGWGVARSVNPTSVDPDPVFNWMTNDLPAGATLEMLRVVPGGSNILLAVNTAGNQLLTLTDTLSGRPTLFTPPDGAITGVIIEETALARVELAWEEMADAHEYEYQVALDEGFGTKIASACGTTEGQVVAVDLFLGIDYYWRVRATEPLPSPWSETWSFTTPLGPGPARPILESPAMGQIDVALRPAFEWSGLADATNYELQVAEECDLSNLVIDKTGANMLGPVTVYVTPSDLKYGIDYCWRVRAINSTGNPSPWSDTGIFTTIEELTVVLINIKPGSYPNSLNVKSKGVLPVAILGTAVFDVMTIDPSQTVNTGPFTVDVVVNPAVPIAGVQFDLSFNSTLIEADSLTEGPFLGLSGCPTFFIPGTINNSAGTIIGVAGTALGTGCSVFTEGTFATINFIADHLDGISPLDLFDVKVVDVDGNQVPIVVYNGEVEVDLTPWDVNDDGCVDISDLVLVAQHWGETGLPGWIPEDANDDGVIDISDLVIVAQHWGEGC